jgi:hypothetical protein
MRPLTQFAARCARTALPALVAGGALLFAAPGLAQTADTTRPIVIKQKKPKTTLEKFEGTVMHANPAQITVRGKANELAVRTFPLSTELGGKMQRIIDRGGYQYGDKVTILYDPASGVAQKIKGKPSKPV